jgi:hypothetical protein
MPADLALPLRRAHDVLGREINPTDCLFAGGVQ